MSNLSSYCRLVDAKIRASGKDLPVPTLDYRIAVGLRLSIISTFSEGFALIR